MLKFPNELSHCGRQVLLVTMSPTPEVVDELRQSSAAFSPPKKPFGPFIPQRLTIAFETINGCESISYMHCRRFALKSTHKIDQIQLPFIVTWHRGCLPFEPCLGTRSVSKLRDAVGRREIGSRSITVSSRRCCETPVTAHRRLQATGPQPGEPNAAKSLSGPPSQPRTTNPLSNHRSSTRTFGGRPREPRPA